MFWQMFRQLASRMVRQPEGSLAPIFALALVPLVGVVGLAVDYSRANALKARVQASLDSAVLAAAKDGSSNWNQVALNTFNANIFNANMTANDATVATPAFTLNNQVYSGRTTAVLPTTFVRVFHMSSIIVGAASAATLGDDPDTSCILTLGSGSVSSVSLQFNGAPNVSLSGCTIRSNTSLDCNGHSGGASASIAAGTATCSNPKSNAKPVPDIYAAVASNITSRCGAVRIGATWTPGHPPGPPAMVTVNQTGYVEYHVCGDLTLSGSGAITGSAPTTDSVIVIENGSLTMDDDAQVSAVRTAIVLTGNNNYPSSINFPSGAGHAATLSLSPPTSAGNPWRGISLYQDPSLTNGVDETWGPGAVLIADGLVYLPKANVVVHGSSASNISQCTKIVAKSFTTNGSVDLNLKQTSAGCASIGLKQWAGNPSRLTQ